MLIRPLLVAFMVSSSGAALADGLPPGQSGIFVGARVGYGLPGGKVGATAPGDNSSDLSDGFKGLVPLTLELGYRVMPHLSLGATLQYGFGIINKDKSDGCDCTGRDISFGANVYLHAAPFTAFDPWLGVGVGYERLGFSGTQNLGDGGSANFDGSLSGIQFLNLQVGGDFAASPMVSVGPYLGLSLGKYDSISQTTSFNGQNQTMSADIQQTAVHHWVTIGLRCRFNL
jgi:hypothetical protein